MGKIRKQIRGTVIMGDGKTYDYDDFVQNGATIDLRDPVNREVVGDLRDRLRVLKIKGNAQQGHPIRVTLIQYLCPKACCFVPLLFLVVLILSVSILQLLPNVFGNGVQNGNLRFLETIQCLRTLCNGAYQ